MQSLTKTVTKGILLFMMAFAVVSCNRPGSSGKSGASVSEVPTNLAEITGSGIDTAALMQLCRKSGLTPASVYQWQDHFVIYRNFPSVPDSLLDQIKRKYPAGIIKKYPRPFYDFRRSYCNNDRIASAWDNIILTANLVADPTMQQEYLDYHKTQFDKWPEVSKGFCNANFQELQVFKSGRQLMLVISIPKGESLDRLNPKTTENNPRVNEWNQIMKKYQEGIPGTRPGEVWVFLKPLTQTPTR